MNQAETNLDLPPPGADREPAAGDGAPARRATGDDLVRTLQSARLRDRMVRVAARYAPAGEAEDAVHDAVVLALASSAKFRGQAQASTWMHTVVMNAARMRRRSDGRRQRRHDEALLEARSNPALAHLVAASGEVPSAPAAASPARLYEQHQEARRVRAAVAGLPAPYRQVAQACFLDEEAPEAVAGKLGVTAACVRTRAVRARQQLARALAA